MYTIWPKPTLRKNLCQKIGIPKFTPEILHQKNFTPKYFFTKMFLAHEKIRPKMFFYVNCKKKLIPKMFYSKHFVTQKKFFFVKIFMSKIFAKIFLR